MPLTPRRRHRVRTRSSPYLTEPRLRDAEDIGEFRVTEEQAVGCIDLTETEDEQYVDLTSSQSAGAVGGANDQSVVVIETPDMSPLGRLPSVEVVEDDHNLPPLNFPRGRFRLPPFILDDDDDDFPPSMIDITANSPAPQSSNQSLLQSPEPIKITCPVCLEDDKSIKRMKRRLASTICGHVFCDECINSAVSSQHCCPVCRKRLTLKNVYKLHI